jgi:hypothetical protein
MVYHNLGSLYEEQQRSQEAIRAFEKCLQYSRDPDERSELRKKLTRMLPEREDVVEMYQLIRIWGVLMLLGILSVFIPGTADPAWGIIMAAVGILSWRTWIPAMFVLYSVLFAWAAVMNGMAVLAGAGLRWLAMAVVLILFVAGAIRRFIRCRRLPLQELFEAGTWPAKLAPPQKEASVTGRFAIAGVVLVLIAAILLLSALVSTVAPVTIAETSAKPQLVARLLSAGVSIAVLALGLGCAALLTKNDRKGWAIGGVVASALILIAWLAYLLVR